MTIVILKNTTGANLTFKGIVIKHVVDRDHARKADVLCGNPELDAAILAGDIVVNNGTNDLSGVDGVKQVCLAAFSNFVAPPNLNLTGTGLDGYSDVIEFGETGDLKNKFIKSAYHNHTSLDATAIALADGRIIHATISTEENPAQNWYLQVIVGAEKGGGVTVKEGVKAATKLDVASTYDGGGKDEGNFDPIDLTSDSIFDDVPTATAFVVGDRILVKDQTDAKQNGVFEVKTAGASGKLERSDDFDSDSDATAGITVPIAFGTTHTGTSWSLDSDADLNVDNLDWSLYVGPPAQFSGGTQIGADLEKTAGVLDKVYTNLTGYDFSAGDRISAYIKQGTTGAGEASEPVIRLFVQYD